jgi:hypothetical protein
VHVVHERHLDVGGDRDERGVVVEVPRVDVSGTLHGHPPPRPQVAHVAGQPADARPQPKQAGRLAVLEEGATRPRHDTAPVRDEDDDLDATVEARGASARPGEAENGHGVAGIGERDGLTLNAAVVRDVAVDCHRDAEPSASRHRGHRVVRLRISAPL